MAKKSSAAIKKALDFLNKEGKRKPGRREMEFVSTGLINLDRTIGGGLVRGRIYELAGRESSGKTTLALEIVKAYQKLGQVVVFVDFECSLDIGYAEKIGVDISEDGFIFDQPQTLEDGLAVGEALIKSGAVGLVVVDSVAAMVPEKELEGSKAIAQQARAFGPEIRKYVSLLHETKTTGLFINQTRATLNSFRAGITTPGGDALKFFASARLFLTAGKSKVLDQAIHMKCRVWKAKVPGGEPWGLSEYEIRYGHGIVRELEILDIAKDKDLISERAGIFTLKNGGKDKKIKGRAKMMELLKSEAVKKWILSKEKAEDTKEKDEEKDEQQ